MATDKPHGDDARKDAVQNRSQLKTKLEGTTSGQLKDRKKDAEVPPDKIIRRYPEPTD